jgi:hypothetical protein
MSRRDRAVTVLVVTILVGAVYAAITLATRDPDRGARTALPLANNGVVVFIVPRCPRSDLPCVEAPPGNDVTGQDVLHPQGGATVPWSHGS